MVFCLPKEDEAVGVVRPLYSKCRKNIIFNSKANTKNYIILKKMNKTSENLHLRMMKVG